jgi:uncharacterized membrane protein YkvA (DUF1232 family)
MRVAEKEANGLSDDQDNVEHGGRSAVAAVNVDDDVRARARREALHAFWLSVKRLPTYARMTAALARDPEVPHRARAMLVVGGGYLVSPIDLVPGIIPVAGQLDDMYVLLMAIRQAIRLSPDEVAGRHLHNYDLTLETIDGDLKAIRQLVRVGLTDGARWSRRRLRRMRSQIKNLIERRQGAST